MSADNGIFVLNLKDQSRIIHAQAIDNLWWSFLDFDSPAKEIVSTRAVEYFGGAVPMDKDVAIDKAFEMAREYRILEYGVSEFNIDITWNELVEEAKKLAVLEILAIENRPGEEWNNKFSWYVDEIQMLRDILEM